jgi:hypothetical protein
MFTDISTFKSNGTGNTPEHYFPEGYPASILKEVFLCASHRYWKAWLLSMLNQLEQVFDQRLSGAALLQKTSAVDRSM